MDEVTQRVNDGIMAMNEKIENVVVDSVDELIRKFYVKKNENIVLPQAQDPNQCCPSPESSSVNVTLNENKKSKVIDELINGTIKNNTNKKTVGFLDNKKSNGV
jgi:hypothetical protein